MLLPVGPPGPDKAVIPGEALRADVLPEIPAGFDDAIREFILKTVAITYQAVPEAHLLDSLKVDGGALAQQPRHCRDVAAMSGVGELPVERL